jgi:hypothetical protein
VLALFFYLRNIDKLDASLIEKLSGDQILSIVGAGSKFSDALNRAGYAQV